MAGRARADGRIPELYSTLNAPNLESPAMPSSTVEDYLKAIHRLAETGGDLVAVGKVATHLGLTPGTATTMMKHLEREGYVDYSPRKGVTLTERGHRAAKQVLRRHRLIELFLVEVMKLDWSEVHEEAEILEHAFSDRLVERIDEMLGRPAHDPHGDPIPDAEGVVAQDSDLRPLNGCGAGSYRLVRVARDEPEYLLWLQERGLRPGVELAVQERDEVAGISTRTVGGGTDPVRVGEAAAASLWVR